MAPQATRSRGASTASRGCGWPPPPPPSAPPAPPGAPAPPSPPSSEGGGHPSPTAPPFPAPPPRCGVWAGNGEEWDKLISGKKGEGAPRHGGGVTLGTPHPSPSTHKGTGAPPPKGRGAPLRDCERG